MKSNQTTEKWAKNRKSTLTRKNEIEQTRTEEKSRRSEFARKKKHNNPLMRNAIDYNEHPRYKIKRLRLALTDIPR